MFKAKKHPIGTTIATAVEANHPQSPAQEGARGMSGRKHELVRPLSGPTKGFGAAIPSKVPSTLHPPGKVPAKGKPQPPGATFNVGKKY